MIVVHVFKCIYTKVRLSNRLLVSTESMVTIGTLVALRVVPQGVMPDRMKSASLRQRTSQCSRGPGTARRSNAIPYRHPPQLPFAKREHQHASGDSRGRHGIQVDMHWDSRTESISERAPSTARTTLRFKWNQQFYCEAQARSTGHCRDLQRSEMKRSACGLILGLNGGEKRSIGRALRRVRSHILQRVTESRLTRSSQP